MTVLHAGSSSARPSSRSVTSAKNRWWLMTTTSASSASLRAFITKHSRWNAQLLPRQLSRVDVTSGQIAAFSGTSASSALGRAGERDDLRQIAHVGARRQPALARRALEMVMADVVGATLQQRDGDRRRQRVADQRQVALEQLVLQRLRSGRHDDLAAVEQRGNEIRERLAGAGPGFGDQR